MKNVKIFLKMSKIYVVKIDINFYFIFILFK